MNWILGLIAWVLVSVASLVYLNSRLIIPFDPQLMLNQAAANAEFDARAAKLLSHAANISGGALLHIVDQGCRCNFSTFSHKPALDKLAEQRGLYVQQLDISDHAELQTLFPATPAVAVLDKQDKLIYLGPYSSGVYCTSSNSLVEPRLRDLNTVTLPGAIIVSEARGCYCST